MKNDIANNPVFASTVLLIRDTNQGLEVFMVTRNKKIDFAYGFDNADPSNRTPNGWETHFTIGQQF